MLVEEILNSKTELLRRDLKRNKGRNIKRLVRSKQQRLKAVDQRVTVNGLTGEGSGVTHDDLAVDALAQ